MMNMKIYGAEDERMAAEIIEIAREACPAARLIGRRYEGAANWNEWWENGWFETLEKTPALPFNGDAYIGARQEKGVHWIGMLFPVGTAVPVGFECVDLPPAGYAVCFIRDAEGSDGFYSRQTREACLERIAALGLHVRDGWRLERYNCPRFTTPDEQGRVVLDWAVEVEMPAGE